MLGIDLSIYFILLKI